MTDPTPEASQRELQAENAKLKALLARVKDHITNYHGAGPPETGWMSEKQIADFDAISEVFGDKTWEEI